MIHECIPPYLTYLSYLRFFLFPFSVIYYLIRFNSICMYVLIKNLLKKSKNPLINTSSFRETRHSPLHIKSLSLARLG